MWGCVPCACAWSVEGVAYMYLLRNNECPPAWIHPFPYERYISTCNVPDQPRPRPPTRNAASKYTIFLAVSTPKPRVLPDPVCKDLCSTLVSYTLPSGTWRPILSHFDFHIIPVTASVVDRACITRPEASHRKRGCSSRVPAVGAVQNYGTPKSKGPPVEIIGEANRRGQVPLMDITVCPRGYL